MQRPFKGLSTQKSENIFYFPVINVQLSVQTVCKLLVQSNDYLQTYQFIMKVNCYVSGSKLLVGTTLGTVTDVAAIFM